MKKQILILAIALSGFTTFAQSKIQFGVRGGLNLSTVVGEDDDFDSPDGIASFYGGVVVEAPINDRFSLQAEAFYSGQGFEISERDRDDTQFQVSYIQVPVLAKIRIIKGLSAMGGGQLGFKINEEIDNDPFDSGGDTETDYFEDYDFQLTGGAEYKFDNGFFVQARVAYGISEVIEDSEVHNFVFSTGVGFMF